MLEIDVNDNLLRDRLCGSLLPLIEHCVKVPDGPGLGFTPELKAVADLCVHHFDVRVNLT